VAMFKTNESNHIMALLKKLEIHRQGAKDAKKSKTGIKIDPKTPLCDSVFKKPFEDLCALGVSAVKSSFFRRVIS